MTIQATSRNCTEPLAIGEFYQALDQALAQCAPTETVALLVVSLHRSDRIASLLNDPAARSVTHQVLGRIRSMLREPDRFVLIGDDEIWLLLPRLRAQAMAMLAVNRLLAILDPVFLHDAGAVILRPSIGIACAPQHADCAALLLRSADRARQAAQSNNTAFMMSEACIGKAGLPDDIEGVLKRVLAANALRVVYQPKVDPVTRRVASVEALVRWPASEGDAVPTALIIDTAERCGLIGQLTMHVLNTLLRERNAWLQEGIDVQVWINLSTQVLAQKALPQLLLQALEVWNTPSASIGLEITESSLVRDIDHTTEILFALQRAGFAMAIDDFGTGYSSLAYLRRFPISELKIDQMFVRGMASSQPDHQIVESIIDLAHNFGLTVVAEGAEDFETVARLRQLGCDLVQGYVYARPMPGEQLVQWIRDFQALGRTSLSDVPSPGVLVSSTSPPASLTKP